MCARVTIYKSNIQHSYILITYIITNFVGPTWWPQMKTKAKTSPPPLYYFCACKTWGHYWTYTVELSFLAWKNNKESQVRNGNMFVGECKIPRFINPHGIHCPPPPTVNLGKDDSSRSVSVAITYKHYILFYFCL